MKLRQKITLFLACLGFLAPNFWARATDYSSGSFKVQDPVISAGSSFGTSTGFQLGQSFAQPAIGYATSTNFQLFSGFEYFFKASANTLSASAGESQVSLSWTVPQTFAGTVIGSYQLGVGTTSGAYTYEDVGSVLSFTKSGLNNGTLYYFKVRAKTPGGIFVSSSNEVSATPAAPSVTSTPGGGGGSSAYLGVVKFSGLTAPQSQVIILKNGSLLSQVVSSANGNFSLTLTGQPTGSFVYSIYYIDPSGIKSQLLNLPIEVRVGRITEAADLLLPPTLFADKVAVKYSDSVSLKGFAAPEAFIAIEAQSSKGLEEFSVKAGKNGAYDFIFLAPSEKFSYSVKTKAVLGLKSSIFSLPVLFDVAEENKSAPLQKFPTKGDFNDDSMVNLIDFSIMAYWFEKSNPPEKIDLNRDGSVDLVDFSILAYYWTG